MRAMRSSHVGALPLDLTGLTLSMALEQHCASPSTHHSSLLTLVVSDENANQANNNALNVAGYDIGVRGGG